VTVELTVAGRDHRQHRAAVGQRAVAQAGESLTSMCMGRLTMAILET
jgi:hypothetical protein